MKIQIISNGKDMIFWNENSNETILVFLIHCAASQLQNYLSAKKPGENPKIRKALFKKFSNDFVDAFYELHQTGTHFEVWIACRNLMVFMLHTVKKIIFDLYSLQ